MKKIFYLVSALVFGFLFSTNVKAANIGQSDFDSALAGTPSNGVNYSTDAADYYLDEGNYTLTSNIDLDGHALFISKEVTLDLNGKTITTAEDVYSAMVVAESTNSNVTIKGNGSIIGKVSIGVYTNGTLTIENGTFGGVEIDSSELTINNGTFEAEYTLLSARGTSNVTINNGTYHGGLEIDDDSDLTINNGTFKGNGAGAVVLQTRGTSIINDGTFTGDGGASAMYAIIEAGNVTINGGTFTSDADNGLEGEGFASVTITG